MLRPSEVQRTFREKYKESPQAATDWFYKFSQDTDLISAATVPRIDLRWKTASDYGDIDITINLAKPERSQSHRRGRKAKSSSYPKCLCMEK